jgi:DNA repair exonuclease SbcCD ATPase subunit
VLTWIELTNFQKHADLKHTFSEGLNLIVGPNWSGKSTLLRAVRYALFGSSAAKVKAENLAGPQCSTWNVRLGFALHGAKYTLERGPRKATLHQGAALRASGHSAVTAEVESLIGPQAAFMAYQAALQGEADTLLTLGAAKLAAHIESVIGSDVVDTVLERIRAVRAPLAAVNTAQTVEWSARLLAAQAAQKEKHALALEQYNALTQLAMQLPAQSALLAARRADLASLMQQANAYAQRERELEQLVFRRSELLAAQDSAEAALDSLCEGEDPALVFTEWESLSAAKQRFDALSAQVGAAQQAAAAAQAQLDALPKPDYDALPGLRTEVSEREAALQALRLEVAVAEANLATHRKMLDGASCPTCGRPFEGHDPQLLAAELTQFGQHALELVQQRNDAAAALEGYSQAVQGLEQQDARRQAAWIRWQELSKAAVTLNNELDQLVTVDAAMLEAVTSRYQAASAAQAALTQARSVLAGCAQALQEVEAKLAALPNLDPVSEAQLIESKQACSHAEQALNEAKLEDAALRERYAALTEALGLLSTEIAGLQEKLAEAGKTRQRIALLDRLSKYLRANRDRFTAHAWNAVLAFASSFAAQASGGDIQGLVRLDDGRFAYQENGVTRDIELASGMQTSILGVGLKLALAAAVNSPFSVLLFDEVSAAASDENALRMTQELAAAGSQILLVSHRDSDASAASRVISL